MRILLALPLALLSTCGGDETISGYADRDAVYRLAEIDGAPFGAEATIRFPEPGRFQGRAPCNAYSGAQSAPYPWFAAGRIAATRMACPDLAQEQAFFAALGKMTLAEVRGTILILSTAEGREMVFRKRQD